MADNTALAAHQGQFNSKNCDDAGWYYTEKFLLI